MQKKSIFTKLLAIIGTVLAWLPILAPIFLTVIFFIDTRIFRFDYLMPAELFLVALVGGGLLLWAAIRARSRQRLIGWGLAIAVGSLVGCQAAAVVLGLAHGDTEPGGWEWVVVLALLASYCLALIVVGAGGIMLLRDLFKPSPAADTAPPDPLTR
jgi:hypothetical protein